MRYIISLLTLMVFIAGCNSPSRATPLTKTENDPRAKSLFERNCAVCHITTKPKDRSKLVAPPIAGVMWHVKQHYPNRAEAIRFIVDYVQNPSHAKALCPSVKRFGLMPPLKLPKEDLEAIAAYIYDNYPPRGFKHRPMGKGMGKGMMGR